MRRIGIALLAAAAGVNIAAAIFLALRDPARASDLQVMYDWCRAWVVDGASLYTGPEAAADYPPNAIVLLAPLAMVPARWLVPAWTVVALALTPVLPGLVLRAASPRRDAQMLVVPALLFLCWAAPRTLLQFSLLSMTLAAIAMRIADSRWLASGVALGLGLAKPHLAGPVAAWMLITGRLRPLAAAAVVVAGGWVIYDARIGESPMTTISGYWRVLGLEYGGRDGLVGHTSIRGWAQLIAGDRAIADAIWIGAALVLCAAVCAVAVRLRPRPLDAGGMAVPAMFCLWSLLATYHNGNNFILVLPAFAFLWFDDTRRGPGKWLPIAVLQGAMMFDVPVRLAGVAAPGALRLVIDQFDRVVVLTTLAYVTAIAIRQIAAHADREARLPR